MGLIKALHGAVGGVMADQWREFFTCDALPADTLLARGQRSVSGRSSNTKGSDNVISDGSLIAVADGQCMIITEQGKVVELCAVPGEYRYDQSTEPSLLYGKLSKTIPEVFRNIGRRFTFGGEPPKDQRVYSVNTKELIGNKYGTPAPVPFRVVDRNIGLDADIAIRCFGEYSYRITNPILFYTNVCGNIAGSFRRSEIDEQLKSELLTALQPAFAKISEMGIRYSALPGHTEELAETLNEVLSRKWSELRGIEIVSIGVSSVKASEEDERMIKELQRNAVFRNPNMAAAQLVGAQAASMQEAAKNPNAGPAMAFMGMNMAQNAGGTSAQALFQMGQQAAGGTAGSGAAGAPAAGGASSAGSAPASGTAAEGGGAAAWTCPKCGRAGNTGRFCPACGTARPAEVLRRRCQRCGWEPEDPADPPRFCPNCGAPFDGNGSGS